MFGIPVQSLYCQNSGAGHSQCLCYSGGVHCLKTSCDYSHYRIIFSVNSHEVVCFLCFRFNHAGAEWEIKPILLIQRKVKFYIYVMFKLSVLITDCRAK